MALDPEDLNIIKDVGSFTQDIQKSIASDLLPDLKDVGDLSSQFVDNLKNAQSESNLDITGIDNIEKMQQSLVASGRSLEKFKDLTRDFRIEMSTASDQTEALAMLDQQKLEVEHKILDVAGSISTLETEKIPEAAKLVEIEAARLSLLNEGTSAYATQKEKLEQSKNELLNLNAGLANNLGVMGSLNKFNDDFIEGQRVSINNMSTMTQYQDDLRTTTGAVFQETNKLLSLNKELNEELQLHGKNMEEFIKTYGGVSDEVMGKFDGIKDSILGSLESIPLIGGMLAKYATGPLEEVSDIAKEAFAGALKVGLKHAQDTGSAMGGIQAGLSHFMGNLQGIGAALKSILSGPFLLIAALTALLTLAFKRFTELEESARELRKNLGGTLQSTSAIFDEVQRLNVEFSHMGVSLEDASASAQALATQFGNFGLELMPKTLQSVTLLSTQLGISNENLAGAAKKFKMLGADSDATVSNLVMAVASASDLAGVNADEVMSDVASASEDTLIFMGKTPGALAASAVQARKLGTTIDDIASTMETMLDFESSINKEMKLSSLLGGHISMHKLRQLSFAGDAEGVAKEQLRLLQQMGGLENMNVFQKRAAAEAMGTSVENLMKMAATEKDRAAFEAKYGDRAIALQEELKKLRDGDAKDGADRMKAQLEEQIQQEKMNQLKNKFNSLMIKLGEKLLPVIEVGMEVLVPILGTILDLVGYILWPFKLIGDAIKVIKEFLSPVVDVIKDLTKPLSTMFEWQAKITAAFLFFGLLIPRIFKGLFTLGGSLFGFLGKGVSGLVNGIRNLIGGLGGTVSKLFESIGSSVQSIFSSIGRSVSNLASGIGTALSNIASGIGRAVTSLGTGISGMFKGIGEGIAGLLRGIGRGIQSFVQQIGRISTRGVLQAGLALVVLAGSMFIAAKAFQQFANVEWDDMAKGVTALIGVSTTMLIVSKILDSAKGSLIMGAIVMGIFSLSLIPLAHGFKQFADVPWENVFYGLGALSVLAVAASLIGKFIVPILLGSIAIGALGLALNPFADSLTKFANIDFKSVLTGVVALGAFAVVAGMMGMFALPIIAGSIAIGALGLALQLFGMGLSSILPAISELSKVFTGVVESLQKLTFSDIGKIGLLGVAMAGLGVALPLVTAGVISVGIMAYSIGKLGDAAKDAGEPLKNLGTGLEAVITNMLKISKQSDAIRDASSAIRDMGGAFNELSIAAGGGGGFIDSVVGFGTSGINAISDFAFGTNKIDQSNLNPLQEIIKFTSSLQNIGNIGENLRSIPDALNSIKEFASGLGVGEVDGISVKIKNLLEPLSLIKSESVDNLKNLSSAIMSISQNLLVMNQIGTSPVKSFIECISNPEVYETAISGFDSLTEAVIRFGKVWSDLGFLGKMVFAFKGKTESVSDELVKKSTDNNTVNKTIVQQSIEKEQSQKMNVTDSAQKGYTFSSFVGKIGGEDKLKELQTLQDNKDIAHENYNNFIDKNKANAIMDQDEFGIDFVKEFSSSELNDKFEKLKSTMISTSNATSELRHEMLANRMKGLGSSARPSDYHQFNPKLNRSMIDLELIQEREIENQLRQSNASPITTQEMGSIGTGTNASVVETISSVTNNNQTDNSTTVDTSGTETRLIELIQLMKSGGIAVHLDGKKVSKTLASIANS